MSKLGVWAQVFPKDHPEGKVHQRVFEALKWEISPRCTFEDIYLLVELSGLEDEVDILATARALRDFRDKRREMDIEAI